MLPKIAYLRDPSHCLIEFSIVQDEIVPVPHFRLILHASLTCVSFVAHNEFDFTRLEKIDLSQLKNEQDNTKERKNTRFTMWYWHWQ